MRERIGDIVRPVHFQRSRPRDGYCYLDFLDFWLIQALQSYDEDRAYKYARELGHYALLMHPELAPLPPNVILGEN
jgi:hypothetical protein